DRARAPRDRPQPQLRRGPDLRQPGRGGRGGGVPGCLGADRPRGQGALLSRRAGASADRRLAGMSRSVAVVTLGCTRNEVDSEELAGRLAAEGWTLVEDAAQADVAVVNTCGFVEQAKKDSIDALLEANDLKRTGRTQKVVAVGCMAERYGEQLAAELP